MTVRVMITEDSDIAAEHIARILSASPEIRIIARARTVAELMHSPARSVAHAFILDMLMPEQAGLSVVSTLAAEGAVVVVSEVGADSPLAAETLARGAAAFVSKQSLADEAGAEAFRRKVLDVAVQRVTSPQGRLIAIGGSTGAVRAYETLVPALRGSSAAIVVVQHLPSDRVPAFAEWLGSLGVSASVASSGDVLTPGHLWVAPGGKHTVIDGGRIRLVTRPAVDGHLPSASVLFSSATVLGPKLAVVVLSGMGSDGASAVADAVARGAMVLVQHPAEAALPSMPQAAMAVSGSVRALAIGELSKTLQHFASHGR